MITYGKQFIDIKDKKAVLETLSGAWLTQGPKVKEFEDKINKKFGSKYCCAVANGTAALHLTGIALGWKRGDIILCSAISFVSGANSVIYSGATPDFVDIDENSYNIDVTKLENKIKKYLKKNKKIKAIIVTDYAGNPSDWQGLKKISKKYNIKLINDNCHALGSAYKKNKKYAVKYADVVIHSYHPVKNITTGEGGAVLTNDKKIFKKIKRLSSHGIIKKKHPWKYEMVELGYNYRLSDIQCALGISQLKKLNKFVQRRNQIANIYSKNFKNSIFKKPIVEKNNFHSYHLYPLQIQFFKLKISKANLFKKLIDQNIKLQVHYIPTYLHPYYKKNFNFKNRNFPVSNKFYNNEISLPIYYNLSNKQVLKVINAIEKICLDNLK